MAAWLTNLGDWASAKPFAQWHATGERVGAQEAMGISFAIVSIAAASLGIGRAHIRDFAVLWGVWCRVQGIHLATVVWSHRLSCVGSGAGPLRINWIKMNN